MLPRKHTPNVQAAPASPKPLALYAEAPPHSAAGDPPAPIVCAYIVTTGSLVKCGSPDLGSA